MSATEQIERHLLSGNTLTGLQAIDLFKVYRLSSVIKRLRDKGLDIETVKKSNGSKEYGEYRIAKKQGELFN